MEDFQEKSGSRKETAAEQKFLTFWTGGELFGIPITDVVQIVAMQKIIPLPDFPDYAKGVINLRGTIIPVIDMRIRMKKPAADYRGSACIIIVDAGESCIGFLVDAVDEVTNINGNDITPAPRVSKNITNHYLTGIGRLGEKVILLLDVSKILSGQEFTEVTREAEKVKTNSDQKDSQPDSKPKTPGTDASLPVSVKKGAIVG